MSPVFDNRRVPLSVLIFAALLSLSQIGALSVRMFQYSWDSSAWVNVAILFGCAGLYAMRRWAFWLVVACLFFIALLQVNHTEEPVRNFFYTGLPVILIAVACTWPHYSEMK